MLVCFPSSCPEYLAVAKEIEVRMGGPPKGMYICVEDTKILLKENQTIFVKLKKLILVLRCSVRTKV